MKQITCNINGIDYPVIFTMGAMLRFKRMTGKEVSEMAQDSIEDAATLIYCATAAGAKSQEMDFPYDLEAFYDCMPIDKFTELSTAVMNQYATPAKTTRSKKK